MRLILENRSFKLNSTLENLRSRNCYELIDKMQQIFVFGRWPVRMFSWKIIIAVAGFSQGLNKFKTLKLVVL
jgi:hypothetical protein